MTAMPPPIILTVDDDPEVSRSLARDLRQQYGEDYRIRRAESGPAALDALKELKLRDESVGLLLADHRMPEMTGVVGHRWSAPSHAVKDFLTRNQVPFRWLELERDAEAARLLAANGGDGEHLPLVITDTGRTLQAPSTAEVASALGLSATPSLPF